MGSHIEVVTVLRWLSSEDEDLEALLGQLLFMILLGNGDAHLKNFSVLYPDGINATLSPAYDLVPTVLFPNLGHDLALELGGSRGFYDLYMGRLQGCRRIMEESEADFLEMVRAMMQAMLLAWREGRSTFGFTPAEADQIEDHLRRVPLLRELFPAW